MSSSKQKRSFIIRGFDAERESFNAPTGVIENMGSFQETVVDITDQSAVAGYVRAVNAMTTDPVFVTMNSTEKIHAIDLKIEISDTDKLDVRALKTPIREILKRWAEKSRVKGVRGFRLSAIRTPKYDYKNDCTVIRTQVLLADTVIYSDNSINYNSTAVAGYVLADINLLFKELNKRLDSLCELRYNSSEIGVGSL